MEDDAFEVTGQARTAKQVAGNHRTQAKAQARAMVVGKMPMALDHQDVQAIVRVGQQLAVAALQQVIEHALAAAADLGGRDALGKILLGIQFAQAADACDRVVKAGTGEAPGTDRSADQGTLPGRRRQPFTEQCQVQALDAQRLRPTRRARQHTDIGRLQAALADLPQGTLAGLEGEGGVLDVDGAHDGSLGR